MRVEQRNGKTGRSRCAVGGSITLLYHATFNTTCLPPAGTVMRVETMVTFGNAGARGGSGAVGSNIDIDGNETLDADEAKVRTVPCRVTLAALPAAPEETNDSVTLADNISTTGTVTTSNLINNVPLTTDASGSWTVSVDVDAGLEGGTVCNGVTLEGEAVGGELNVIVGYETGIVGYDDLNNPIYGQVPIYATYECAAAAEGSASSCVDVGTVPPPLPKDGDYCSFSQGGFGGSGEPYDRLANNFATLYPSGVEVGIPGGSGFSMKFTTVCAVQKYLPAGGTAGALNADIVSSITSGCTSGPASPDTSSGQFGGQVLALKLNIALSDAGINPAGFGDLYYCDATSSLNGQTIRQILAAAETALGGGALPTGYNYSALADLCANLDLSFDGKSDAFPTCGVVSQFANDYLRKDPCP